MSKNKPSKKKKSAKKPKLEAKSSLEKKTKRPAKRKAKRISVSRKQNTYNIVQTAISDYCLRKYGRKCSKKEISEIYQSLKLRYIGRENTPFSPQEIAKTIDERLAYNKNATMPTFLKDFIWYKTVDLLVFSDGGFFKPDDRIIINMKPIGLGVRKTTYNELGDVYAEDIYPDMREYLEEVESATNLPSSDIQPSFVLDEDETDEAKRIFVWKVDIDARSRQDFENGEEGDVVKQKKDEDKGEGEEKEKKKEKPSGSLAELKAQADIKEKELKIEKQKTLQKALDLLERGLIDQEQFNFIIRQ